MAAILWLRAENAWLRSVPPHTLFVVRMEGITHDSKEYNDLMGAAVTVFWTNPRGFQPDDHWIDSQRWPRPCAWYKVIGASKKGANLESDLPLLKAAMEKEMEKTGLHSPWRLALVFPDGRVVHGR